MGLLLPLLLSLQPQVRTVALQSYWYRASLPAHQLLQLAAQALAALLLLQLLLSLRRPAAIGLVPTALPTQVP